MTAIRLPENMKAIQLAATSRPGTALTSIDWRGDVRAVVDGIRRVGNGMLVVFADADVASNGVLYISDDCVNGLINGRGAPFVTTRANMPSDEIPNDAELVFYDDRR